MPPSSFPWVFSSSVSLGRSHEAIAGSILTDISHRMDLTLIGALDRQCCRSRNIRLRSLHRHPMSLHVRAAELSPLLGFAARRQRLRSLDGRRRRDPVLTPSVHQPWGWSRYQSDGRALRRLYYWRICSLLLWCQTKGAVAFRGLTR